VIATMALQRMVFCMISFSQRQCCRS
jgi:hypothetical protein